MSELEKFIKDTFQELTGHDYIVSINAARITARALLEHAKSMKFDINEPDFNAVDLVDYEDLETWCHGDKANE